MSHVICGDWSYFGDHQIWTLGTHPFPGTPCCTNQSVSRWRVFVGGIEHWLDGQLFEQESTASFSVNHESDILAFLESENVYWPSLPNLWIRTVECLMLNGLFRTCVGSVPSGSIPVFLEMKDPKTFQTHGFDGLPMKNLPELQERWKWWTTAGEGGGKGWCHGNWWPPEGDQRWKSQL